MQTDIVLYVLIFAIGFLVGRIATAIQLGLKYKEHILKIKEKYKKKYQKSTSQKKRASKGNKK